MSDTRTSAGRGQGDGFERTLPEWRGEQSWLRVFREPPHRMEHAHWHSHVEINFPTGCSMRYVIRGREVSVPREHVALFWAAIPHQVVDIEGDGLLTCIYLSLEEFMRWKLPVRLCHETMHGDVLVALEEDAGDPAAFDRWLEDNDRDDPQYHRLALDEIRLRLHRLALSGWRSSSAAHEGVRGAPSVARGMAHVETMATFIADHYHEPIGVAEVAGHVGLHPNYAMSLFKRVVGLPVAAYITRHRLSHAQAMLLGTDKKVLAVALDCGFGSLSSFYDTFRQHLNRTPREYRDEHAASAAPARGGGR